MDIATDVSTFATGGIESVWLLVGNFLVLLILTVIMIGFSYKTGRGGIISLIIAFYAGYALYIVFPFTDDILNAGGSTIVKAVISIALYGAMTFVPFHFIQRLTSGGFGILSFVPRLLLSFLAAAFLLTLAYHVFQISNIYSFPDPINSLFAPDEYFFWWFIAPLVGLIFLVR
ncbi:MAG TPA: hypothetical protein VJA87_01510 [Candidatus Paceibacterota bacterium]